MGIIVAPMWVLFMPARETVGLMLPLLIAGDIATLAFYWNAWDRRNVITLFPGAVIGIAAGMMLMGMLPDREFKLVIGALALVFGLAQAARQWMVPATQKLHVKPWMGVLAGIGTGTISALAHLGGLITTLFLLPQNLGNRVFVATSTVFFFLINLTKVPPYVYRDLITIDTLMTDLSLIPAIVVGAVIGAALNKRIPERPFAWIVLGFVLLTGLKLIAEYVGWM